MITQADETPVATSAELVSYISAAAVGDSMELTVYRQGSSIPLTVEVGEQIQSAREDEESEQEEAKNPQGKSKFPQVSRPFVGR